MSTSGTLADDRARQIVEGLGEGFLSLDDEWRITDCNRVAARYLRSRPGALLGRKVWEIPGLAIHGPFAALVRRVARTQVAERAEITYPHGVRDRLLSARVFPLQPGIAAVVRDITRVRAAEKRLADSETRYRELADGTPAAAFLSGADGALEFINQAMADVLGRPRQALLGEGWMASIDPAQRASLLKARAHARRAHSNFNFEGRFRNPGGGLKIIQMYGRPRFDASGAFRGIAGMATDVTERRAAERAQMLLIDELNHRVKNTLATAKTMVAQTLRESGVAKEVEVLVTARLQAVATAHDVLNREKWDGATVSEIAQAVARPYDNAQRITIEGPVARLGPSVAVNLAIALHELAVNALKHGALSSPTGRVRLSWTRRAGRIAIAWAERGGPIVSRPKHAGFGSRLLRQGFGAELKFAASGLTCRFEVSEQNDGGSSIQRDLEETVRAPQPLSLQAARAPGL